MRRHIRTYISLIFFSMLIPVAANAQDEYDGDQRPLHFGFSLGIATADFGIKESLVEFNGKTYNVDVSTLRPGFSVGIIGDLAMWRYLNLRFTPTLHFIDRELRYKPVGGDASQIISTRVPSIPVSLPVYLKYSSTRYRAIRPYVLAGGSLWLDLAKDRDRPVSVHTVDVLAEVGVGCDIYFSFFKLAPEIKLGIGGTNAFVPLNERDTQTLSEADRLYSIALSKLTSRLLTFTFNFE